MLNQEIFSQIKQWLGPALLSLVALGLLKLGLFVTPIELERSFRQMESGIKQEYASRESIQLLRESIELLRQDNQEMKATLLRLEDRWLRHANLEQPLSHRASS
ncbi:MAG: hypothetical protein SFZ03_04810 [Candidatus Melainabacteria bacterium]|nr:hypothetical protein [Candidatus Melainabacteria bacterium]